MVPVYYRGANAAILVFDITNYSTFTDVQTWVQGNNNCVLFKQPGNDWVNLMTND